MGSNKLIFGVLFGILAVGISSNQLVFAEEHTEITDCGDLDLEGGTYVLQNNIFGVSNPICFEIKANNVTLDGNGFIISGSEDCDTNLGVLIKDPFGGLTVKNLTIVALGGGIVMESSDGNTIVNNTIKMNCNIGIGLFDSTGNLIETNMLESNGSSEGLCNCELDSFGQIFLDNSFENVIKENTVFNGGQNGITLFQSSGNTLTDNDVFDNEENGFVLRDAFGNTFTLNTSSGNNHGFDIEDSDNNIFDRNDASFNSNDLIKVKNSSNNTFTGNTANGSSDDSGFDLEGATDNTFTDNFANNNDGDGFEIGLTDDTGGSHNNTFTGNTANLNEGKGFRVDDSDNNTFTKNTIFDNRNEGMRFKESDSNEISNNSITKNNDDGIEFKNSHNNKIFDNIITGNDDEGIDLDDDNTGNTFTNNNVSDNDSSGIELSSDDDNNTFTGNTVSNNGDEGFAINDSRGNIFTLNTVNSNADSGFDLENSSNNNTFSCNTVMNNGPNDPNGAGFEIENGGTAFNMIFKNLVQGQSIGIGLFSGAKGNVITNNNIIDNEDQLRDSSGAVNTISPNFWGDDVPGQDTNPLQSPVDLSECEIPDIPPPPDPTVNAVHSFDFNGNLNDSLSELVLSNPFDGTVTSTAYVFEEGQGLMGDSFITLSTEINPETYSIEMCLKVDEDDDWRKLVDFHNLNDDEGLYVNPDDELEFFNEDNGITIIPGNTFFHVVLTRDGESTKVTGFLDGNEEFSFFDDEGLAVTLDNAYWFVKDDFDTSESEETSGTLNYIRVYDEVLGESQIASQASGCLDETRKKSGGGDNQWDTRPTFGISHETRQDQIVENGFTFNTEQFTLTDNHWTDFAEQSIEIGMVNTFSATVWADKGLKVQEFLFGIPDVGMSHLAEFGVEIWYDIDGEIQDVIVVQNSHVIDADTISVSHEKTKCLATDAEARCDTTTVSMTFLEPLQDKVMAIKAIDWKNRDQRTYLNDGFDISGESLNPMLAKMIPSTVRYEGLLKVTQVAKYSPYWVTDDDRMFEMNSFGSFKQINQSFERFQDTGTAYTRMHSGFGGIIAYEQDRALDIFDASNLVSELPASFAYIFPETGQRMTDEMREAMLLQEQIAKGILDEMDRQNRHY